MSLRRLYLLLKRELVMGYSSLLFVMAAAAGLIFVFAVLSMTVSRSLLVYPFFFSLLLYLGGWVFAASVFKELHQPASGSFLLSLPGSTLEKFASKLLISAVGYPVWVAVFVAAVSVPAELVNRALFGASHPFFNPWSVETLQEMATFTTTQAIFFLGSVWFRKLAFIKTALSLTVLFIGFMIVTGLFLTFQSFKQGGGYWNVSLNDLLPQHAWIAVRIGVASLCWGIAYLRLSRTEV